MLNWTTTNRASAEHGVKILVYGRAGVGKTRLCSTAPSPVILSAESGLLSLAHVEIPVVLINTVQDLTEVYNWLLSSSEAKQFQTVCLDSLSDIAETVLANAKLLVKDPRQAYGELMDKMMMTVKAFRDLPGKHVYMAAKLEPVKDAVGVIRNMPAMPGTKLGPSLPYLFDEVFKLDIGKDTEGNPFRYLQTAPDMQSEAKDRSGRLEMYEAPDLTHIINKVIP